ncbi:MAG: glycoside hydrolase family 2 TIM barrel-domain containing protein [Elusimicrobiota bacterium]
MSKLLRNLLLFALIMAGFQPLYSASRVEIKDGWFYVDGEKYFVKGLGHELGARPGEIPWERKFNPEFLRYDLKLIKEGNFNTIRTWNYLTEQELRMINEAGIMVIQGFWFDIDRYLNEPDYAREMESKLREVVAYSKAAGNVLFYSINNEPEPWIAAKNGVSKVNDALKRMKSIVKEVDPGMGVSIANAHWNECYEQDMWDVLFYNFYIYGPITNRVMGYREHLEWFKQAYAKDKPFVVGEFGLSVSKSGAKEKFGYGGNTEEDQKNGDLLMYESIISAGLQGGCLFMWNDGWWKAGSPNKHDDHAEEWYGVLGIQDEKSDPKGKPRPVYYAFKEYNQAIVTSPRNLVSYTGKVPVEIYAVKNVKSIDCVIGEKKIGLARNGLWFKGEFDCAAMAEGKKEMLVKVRAGTSGKNFTRKLVFWTGKSSESSPVLSLSADKDSCRPGDNLGMEISFVDGAGRPVPGAAVRYGYHVLLGGDEKEFEGVTDSEGKIKFESRFYGKEVFVKFVAAAEQEKDGEKVKYSAAKFITMESGIADQDLEVYGAQDGDVLYDFEYDSADGAKKDFSVVYKGAANYVPGVDTENKRGGNSALVLDYEPAMAGSWGYTQNAFPELRDISDYKAFSFWVRGDNSWNKLKVMLIDEDGERWFDSEIRLTWSGWRKVISALGNLARDPYDQVTDGNNRPDYDKVKGIAIVMASGGNSTSKIIIDKMEVYR